MAQTQEQVKLIVSIVGHGQSKSVIRFYEKNQVGFHYRCLGRGTASSELLDVLGLGGTEREIVFSLAAGSIADHLMNQLHYGTGEDIKAQGIAFLMPLSAISNLPGIPLLRQGAMENKRGGIAMEQKSENSLILVVVNQGYTEEVMNTARAAGARGGTVLRSRWSGEGDASSLYGVALQEEAEMIFIVTSTEKRNVIMETIQKKHGRDSEAGAMICSIGLEQTVRLS